MDGITGEQEINLIHKDFRDSLCEYMVHVGSIAQKIFIFKPENVFELIMNGEAEWVSATQKGYKKTSEGWKVELVKIKDLFVYDIPEGWCDIFKDKTERGKNAEEIVCRYINRGFLKPWQKAIRNYDKKLQYADVDIIVDGITFLSVKFDERAGWAEKCSGNVYIEALEANPNKIYA
jgi:hypothetical protein